MRGRALILTFLLAGCGGGEDRYIAAVRARARVAMTCPITRVHAYAVGGGGYVAAGCGQRQSYTCAMNRTSGWSREVVCTPDGPVTGEPTAGGSTASEPETSPSSTASDDIAIAMGAFERCDLGTTTASVTLTIGRNGRAIALDMPGVPAELGTCLLGAAWSVEFAPRTNREHVEIELRAR